MSAWWPCLALSRMSSGCSGSLLGDMATRCALVQVRAVAGPRWGPASSAKMLESLNVLEYLCGCAPFFSHDMCAPFASSRADRATVGPAKQASSLACLLAWTRFWKSDGTILRFLEATLHRGESRKPGARKKRTVFPTTVAWLHHLFSLPSLICPLGGAATVWSR